MMFFKAMIPLNDLLKKIGSYSNIDTIDELIPTKRIKNHQNLPWVNKDIRHKIKKRRKLYDHAKSTGNPSSWAQYKQIKNDIIAKLRSAHDAYCSHLFDSSNHKRF